ncbi:LPXTG cell wall anchor domain-containing protein [Allorhizocola rhizosphaerae]|uniref:LPXTG cell wall anchor domain-containing protein n=1 Tax=Allorhizocola rhizosphaerae TaxID=1872709 RepID=UPI000E3C83F8|nr:LPXTG cell wall anchor domain-containing protein [Allorhizocola rhizosphaerae]
MRRLAVFTAGAVVTCLAIAVPAYAGEGPAPLDETGLLPNTGVKISMVAFAGLTLLILGGGAIWASRRRRR